MMKKVYLVLGLAFLIFSCTVVKHDEQQIGGDKVEIYFDNGGFDAAQFVTERWETEIVSEVMDNASEIDELISLMKNDPEAASAGKWAVQIDETAPVNYMTFGEGYIVEAKIDSAAATITVQTAAGNQLGIQIGPVIKFTSIRDSMSFIRFEDFTNQLEYANVSKEINVLVRDKIVSRIDRENLIGKSVSFYGCFTDNRDMILLTPVKIELEEGGHS